MGLPGEKKKSKGLLGKLKSITKKADRSISEERGFGSGSDISSVSVASKHRTKATPFGPPGNANAAFDKYFDKADAGGAAAAEKKETNSSSATASRSAAPVSSTLPRTYRRF